MVGLGTNSATVRSTFAVVPAFDPETKTFATGLRLVFGMVSLYFVRIVEVGRWKISVMRFL